MWEIYLMNDVMEARKREQEKKQQMILRTMAGDLYCDKCSPPFPKEQQMKMTREEAVKKAQAVCYYPGSDKTGNVYVASNIVDVLTALGLLKFDEEEKKREEEKIKTIFKIDAKAWNIPSGFNKILASKYGTICLEEWPEGIVLLVGGRIVYKSWEGRGYGHVKPNVENWTVSKGDDITVTLEGWKGNNPQFSGVVQRIEKSPGS